MPRLSVLLAALALLAGCDATPAPEPFNPVDPAFDGARTPTGPSTLDLTASTSTSVTLRWDDRSSFEAGYVVLGVPDPEGPPGATRPPVELPPDATSYTVEGLVRLEPTTLAVRVLRAPGVPAGEPVSLTVRYGGLQTFEVETGAGGLLSPETDRVYRLEGDGTVGIYAVAFGADGPATRVGGAGPFNRLVGRMTGGDIVVENVLGGADVRDVASLRGEAIVLSPRLRSPDGVFVGRGAMAVDGSRFAARYETAGGTRIGVWNAATNTFLGDAPDPSQNAAAEILMVTVGGTVVMDDGEGGVVAVRLADGAEVWREATAPIDFRVAVDPFTGRVALAQSSRTVHVRQADDGATVATVPLGSAGGPKFIGGSTLIVNDGPSTTLRSLPSGEIIRGFRGPTEITSGAVFDGALVLFDGRETLGRGFRLAPDAVWEVADPTP